ncbi:MAG: hypothetical protein K0S37_787 [Microbacterium sp.]|nr:hypothetical protein [Microbacterium sp.]
MSTATSASDRYEAARNALSEVTGRLTRTRLGTLAARETDADLIAMEKAMRALRALIEPAAVNETPEQIADRVTRQYEPKSFIGLGEALVQAGIQAGWNDWEPENAPGLPSGTLEQLAADAEELLEFPNPDKSTRLLRELVDFVKGQSA